MARAALRALRFALTSEWRKEAMLCGHCVESYGGPASMRTDVDR